MVAVGELVCLRPLTDRDHDALWDAAHDPVTSRLTGLVPAGSREAFDDWTKRLRQRADRVDFAITTPNCDDLIGHAVFTQMDEFAGRADMRMSMLPGHRGRGYGREAVFRLLELAFAPHPHGYGLHRVGLVVLALNPRAKELYESYGFQEEGTLRDYARDGESYTNATVMSLLADEFDASRSIYTPRTHAGA
ncbi:RimJ/RimL family protein N-acetyltransferase [Rarobacter incanus]|uniref:RimJ/RimL family protein N-acetyltransferase n=2 Tax=Rarobacter incanus TaxID=153494 RepID=A0A542SNG3_9MICO|nr:RimJ/RimL family protein N-acetyltransferase [Rarobacter incanus]